MISKGRRYHNFRGSSIKVADRVDKIHYIVADDPYIGLKIHNGPLGLTIEGGRTMDGIKFYRQPYSTVVWLDINGSRLTTTQYVKLYPDAQDVL